MIGESWGVWAGLLFDFKSKRQIVAAWRGLEQSDGGWPVNGAVVGRQVLVLFAVIVVNVGASDKFAQRFEAVGDAVGLGIVCQMRVANIEIEAYGGQSRFGDKRAKVGGLAHFAGGVFDADGHSSVVGVK